MAPSLQNLARRSKAKKPVVVSQKAAKPKTTLPTLSSEFVQDSDSEEVESDEESSSNDEPGPSKSTATKAITNGKSAVRAVTSSDSSESESGSGSDDSSSSEEEDEVEEIVKPASKQVRILSNGASASAAASTKEPEPKSVASKNFKPPHGFEIASLSATSNAAQMFKKSNLEGKQLWYITAPASVPLAKIKKMSLRDVKKGKPVLNYKQCDYGFSKDSIEDSSHTKVMIPNKERDGLRIVEKQLDQILHLKQLVKLPGVSSTSAAGSSKATIPTKRPPRQQPKGLKMRFRPLGFGEGKTGKIGSSSSEEDSSSESEDLDAPRKFRQPSPIESIASPKPVPKDSSDGSSSDSDEEMTEAPPLPVLPPSVSKTTLYTSQDTNGHPKRKHKDGQEKQSKSSSSKNTISTDNAKLRPEKKKQTEPPKSKAGQLVSTEARRSTSYIPPPVVQPKLATPALKRDLIVKPEEDGKLSQSSREKKKKRKHSTEKDEMGGRATDDADEPPKKLKKLKHKLGPAWHQS